MSHRVCTHLPFPLRLLLLLLISIATVAESAHISDLFSSILDFQLLPHGPLYFLLNLPLHRSILRLVSQSKLHIGKIVCPIARQQFHMDPHANAS